MQKRAFRTPVGRFNEEASQPGGLGLAGPDAETREKWAAALEEIQIGAAPRPREEVTDSALWHAAAGLVAAAHEEETDARMQAFFGPQPTHKEVGVAAMDDLNGQVRRVSWADIEARCDGAPAKIDTWQAGPAHWSRSVRVSLHRLTIAADLPCPALDGAVQRPGADGGKLSVDTPVLLLTDRISPVTQADLAGEMYGMDWLWDAQDGLGWRGNTVEAPAGASPGVQARAAALSAWLRSLLVRRHALFQVRGEDGTTFLNRRAPYTGLVRATILWTHWNGSCRELYATDPSPPVDAGHPGALHALVRVLLEDTVLHPVRDFMHPGADTPLFCAIPTRLPRSW